MREKLVCVCAISRFLITLKVSNADDDDDDDDEKEKKVNVFEVEGKEYVFFPKREKKKKEKIDQNRNALSHSLPLAPLL